MYLFYVNKKKSSTGLVDLCLTSNMFGLIHTKKRPANADRLSL
ncbi:hypothetical protein D922_00673 [Enterococcus faecalis 06-MB-DW-09]|nr:hypothetical protein D922_00673 [Enterococcus faecalis 06-MB-DW-09]